jgi:hypothetical protein
LRKEKTNLKGESYVCSTCGREHEGIPFSFAADFPDNYANLSKDDRDTRTIIGSDQCVIDQEQFYIRGCLELPIQESDDVFLWGVWATVHEKDFDELSAHWETEGREKKIGPFKGRLANSLSIYPDTFNLRLEVKIEPVGTRPLFFLEEPEHPLTIEQRKGLTKQKAEEYACLLLRMAKL